MTLRLQRGRLGDQAVDLHAVQPPQHLLGVVDLTGLCCGIPAQRTCHHLRHLVQQLAGDQPPEGEGGPADEHIGKVPDLLMAGHEFKLADAEFAG